MILNFKKIKKLELIIFTSGSVVMILELIGARILAPFLGTSIFVWTSLIGIILGALSVGYHLGGKFSRKNPSLDFLAKIFLAAGVLIFIIPLMKDPVLSISTLFGVKWGSVFATICLFTLPSIILGMVSPYVIRLKVETVEETGNIAGNLYALSTLGSITGTFLAGFYLIPAFGSVQIIYGLSIVLLILSILSKKKLYKFVLILLFLSGAIVSANAPSKFLYEADSEYNHIRVFDTMLENENREIRGLLLATELHSIVYKDSNDLYAPYNKIYELDTVFNPNIQKGLVLGGGAYIVPSRFLTRLPEAQVSVVEIDPAVTQVAKDYFGVSDNERLKIYHEDARIFLNNNQEKFDVIYGDAFSSSFSVPFHLTTEEAVKLIYNSLEDDGVVLLNIASALEGEKSLFFQAEYKTYQKYFKNLYVIPSHYYSGEKTDKLQNIILVATKSGDRLTKENLLERSPQNAEFINHLWEKDIEIDSNIKTLTDNLAPVDYYISKIL